MKQIFRILFGLLLSPLPIILGTCFWVFSEDEESWLESVGSITWHIVSGQWDKLPD